MEEWAQNASTALPAMLPTPADCPGKPALEQLRWEGEVSEQVANWLDAVVGTAIGITGTIGTIRSTRLDNAYDDLRPCAVHEIKLPVAPSALRRK